MSFLSTFIANWEVYCKKHVKTFLFLSCSNAISDCPCSNVRENGTVSFPITSTTFCLIDLHTISLARSEKSVFDLWFLKTTVRSLHKQGFVFFIHELRHRIIVFSQLGTNFISLSKFHDDEKTLIVECPVPTTHSIPGTSQRKWAMS